MTFYVRFEDNEEYVVCADDEELAVEMATDLQKQRKGPTKIVESKWVADK